MATFLDGVKKELTELGKVIDDPTRVVDYVKGGAVGAFEAVKESPLTDKVVREGMGAAANTAVSIQTGSHIAGQAAGTLARQVHDNLEPVREVTRTVAAGSAGYSAGWGRTYLAMQVLPAALLYKGARKILGL